MPLTFPSPAHRRKVSANLARRKRRRQLKRRGLPVHSIVSVSFSDTEAGGQAAGGRAKESAKGSRKSGEGCLDCEWLSRYFWSSLKSQILGRRERSEEEPQGCKQAGRRQKSDPPRHGNHPFAELCRLPAVPCLLHARG